MKNATESTEPLLSVILATDTIGRVERVIESIAAQTIAKRIELILVTTSRIDESVRERIAAALHSVKLLDVESIVPLSVARAKGVRVSAAPFIFIAETHAYPDPALAEKLIGALSGEWSLAVPGFRNSNPQSGLSWAGFLSDYGAYSQNLEAGEIHRPPSHDAAFRRSVLLEFGDRLDKALTFGDELYTTLHARGQRCYFEPTAGIQHVNISRFGSFVRERYLSGVLVGGYRSERWSLQRRLVYALGSPLIPIVILSRIRKGVKEARQSHSLPAMTIPALMLGASLKAADFIEIVRAC